MAKTNFTKVEGLLEAELAKMEAKKLDKLADIAQNVKRPEMRKMVESAAIANKKTEIDRSALIHSIQSSMKKFKDPTFYTAIGITLEELQALLEIPKEKLDNAQWNRLLELRPKIQEFKKKYIETHPEAADTSLIEGERHKHINKRFNVKDKWLPLK